MAIRIRRRRTGDKNGVGNEVLGTYTFPSRTVQVLKTQDDRILWTCDCDKFRRQSGQRESLWCKHIAKAAARRSLERLTRRVAWSRAPDN
jgi:hypothetical protein